MDLNTANREAAHFGLPALPHYMTDGEWYAIPKSGRVCVAVKRGDTYTITETPHSSKIDAMLARAKT